MTIVFFELDLIINFKLPCKSMNLVLIFTLLYSCSLSTSSSNSVINKQYQNPNLKKICPEPDTKFDDTFANFAMQLITQIKCHMKKGIPELKIPPLDPLNIPNQNFNFEQSKYKISGNVSNIKVINLSSFNVKTITTDLLDMTVNISLFIPFFILQGNYNVKGQALYIFPIYGKGPFTIKPINITVAVFGTVGVTDNDYIILKSLQFNLDVKKLNTKFEGMYGGGTMGKLFNEIVNSLGSFIFHKVEPKVHEKVRGILIDEVNKLLKGIKLSDVVNRAL